MVMLDTFNSDNFGVVSLTTALNKMPFKPQWLGSLGLFNVDGITSTTAVIEERHGRLSLVPVSARGTTTDTEKKNTRVSRAFRVPHIALSGEVLADEVQNIRAFGSESEVETVADKVNMKNLQLRNNIEVTIEYWRHCAIQGKVLDSDMSTEIFNYFTDFGVTEQTEDFVFSSATTNIKGACTSVIRKVNSALGAEMITGVVGLAGDEWFDALIDHATVKTAYERWNDGAMLRSQQIGGTGYFAGADGQMGFVYGGIQFFNSRASINSNLFIPTDQCRFFPLGVQNLFQEIYSPADYEETVNTRGLPVYAKQERMPFDKGRQLEVQSNPFVVCTRPRCLVKGTKS